MTNRNSRLGGKKAPTPTATTPIPPMPSVPAILPSPLTPMHWLTLESILVPDQRGDEHERAAAVEALMKHAVVREKIMRDLVHRLDNLLTVCEQEKKYADALARAYCKEKLAFMVAALLSSVKDDLADKSEVHLQ